MGANSVKMLTVQEVAVILHAHPNTIRHWCDEGLLKAQRIGPRGDRRFLPEDVENFITSYGKERHEKVDIEGDGILVVDDDPDFSELMKDTIEEEGYKVTICRTVKAALEEIEKQCFALIFLDLVLPGASGLDVLRAIKSREEKSVVAVITGYGDDPIALKAMELGPMFFVRKPFKIESIIDILNITFAKKH